MRVTVLLLLTAWSLLDGHVASQKPCERGWFGSSCQYKCRCRYDAHCTPQGDCPAGVSCQRGWFGPACQYADLAYRARTTQWKVTDGNDSSCLTTLRDNENVVITLNDSIHFTWLRVRVSNPDLIYSIKVHFRNDTSLSCTNIRTARVDNTSLDIHCDLNQTVDHVYLAGTAIQNLCSVYISGGRNVALKQPATQSSVYREESRATRFINKTFDAPKAVDGNRDGGFFEGLTCTHTVPRRPDPNLNVTFSRLHYITRYVLYNRNSNKWRLQHFELRSFSNDSGPPVLHYKDNSTSPQLVYTVTPQSVDTPIRLVNIRANNSVNILTLCELEVYGDSNCDERHYGRECEHECNCDGGQPCFVSTGACPSGCASGYHGEDCSIPCDPGKYGPGCVYNCSSICVAGNTTDLSPCDHVTGFCMYGCLGGYDVQICKQVSDSGSGSDSDQGELIGIIVGCVLGVIVLAVIIVAVIVILRRQKRGKPHTNDNSQLPFGGSSHSLADDDVHRARQSPPGKSKGQTADNSGTRQIYYNSFAGDQPSTVVRVDELADLMTSKDKDFFKSQFSAIPVNETATMIVGLSSENKHKNRYKNVCAYDHSRVHLIPNAAKKHGDYINASYIEGYLPDEKFIASQGPTKIILEDFVRMLWEQQVEKVVMLTNLVEEGKQKCERYWPDDRDMKVGEITVSLSTTEVFADYTIHRLQLKKDGRPTQGLIHFHFTSWPDKDVPNTPWGLVDFEQRVASYPTNKPIVVHCSAGVGRTGTFIALRNVMREAEETGHMDFFTAVGKLRQNRINMVQTADQYIFLHNAALVAILCIGTTVTSKDIEKRVAVLETKLPSGQIQMEAEFQSVCSACDDKNEEKLSDDNPSNVYENSGNVNSQKNREESILPKELYRAKLRCENDDMADYINAVLVPSFSKQNQQILTQLPLPSTVTDFWRLVTQYKVTVIVAFQADLKSTDPTIADYLPLGESETSSNLPMFKISTKSTKSGMFWRKQEVTVTIDTNMMQKFSVVTNEHQLTHLACTTTNLDKGTLLTITQQIRSMRPAGSGRTLYMCRNGAEYSGLVCVLALLLDRMDNDYQLTVPLVVGAIKSIRPQVIPTLDQYKLLYEALQLYSESFNEYTNLGSSH